MNKQELITQQTEVLEETNTRFMNGEATQAELDEAHEELKRIKDSKE
jgi:hypothetical protein